MTLGQGEEFLCRLGVAEAVPEVEGARGGGEIGEALARRFRRLLVAAELLGKRAGATTTRSRGSTG